jgi:hypothetical protein
MSRLLWNTAGERLFETGVDRGVLYPTDDLGYAWNGLISVAEAPTGGDAKAYYLDGVKFLNVSTAEEFEATLEAFSSPAEFAACEGVAQVQNGLFVSQQRRKSFGLTYRTLVGNDIDGLDHGYKIHIVYNALAAPAERNNATMGDSITPTTLSWQITTRPPAMINYKPTAHFVVDTRYAPKALLQSIESILYGSSTTPPRLPNSFELMGLFGNLMSLRIVPLADPNSWEIHTVDQEDVLKANTIMTFVRPPMPEPGEEPILWLDSSDPSAIIPKLLTGE